MEDLDRLQGQFENIDRLLDALLPFVSPPMQSKLFALHQMLEPLKHMKDMMQTMEMLRTMQAVMSETSDGTPDFSKLSSFLTPDQMQMFEMFQTMQDIL